ncbi:MAG: hypothetical protein AAF926_00330 [Pseudomonadota bacterium]
MSAPQFAFAQGEIYAFRVEAAPSSLPEHTDVNGKGQPIISHSESGHHHVLEKPAKVFVDEAMDRFYAIVDEANALIQDAQGGHEAHDLEPGIYEFRIAREYDPFAEEIRRVAD